jgi:tight adherence protein B
MAELAALAAVGAMVATLLMALAVGRGLVARWTMRRRAERFLDFGYSAPTSAQVAEPPSYRAALAAAVAFVRTHPVDVLLALPAVVLFVVSIALRWVPGLVLGAGGVALAVWLVRRADTRERDVLEEQLVPALQMMAAGMESGYSIQQALERVVRDSPSPIADKFAQVVRAVELGTPLDAALAEMAAAGGDNFEFFATIVSVQHRVGGDLPALLAGLATSIHERLRLKAEVQALTAQARYSGWVVTALPFAVVGLMLLASPTYITPLFTSTTGRVLLLLAAVLLAAGVASIRTISRVEV